jgi:hypothetical protein
MWLRRGRVACCTEARRMACRPKRLVLVLTAAMVMMLLVWVTLTNQWGKIRKAGREAVPVPPVLDFYVGGCLPAEQLRTSVAGTGPGSGSGAESQLNGAQSEDGIDRYARDRFFHGSTSGSFVEVGAGAGSARFSSTIALEQAGWRGLLVEASAAAVRDLTAARPLATVAHAAVCDSDEPVHFVGQNPEAGGCGMAGAGIVELMPELYLKSWHPRIAYDGSESSWNGTLTSCVSLTSVLQAAGILRADFLALDVVSSCPWPRARASARSNPPPPRLRARVLVPCASRAGSLLHYCAN